MNLLHNALRAGHSGRPGAAVKASAIVVGGGGKLGSAVLERLLASRRFAHVRVLVGKGFTAAMHGLEPVVVASFDDEPFDAEASDAEPIEAAYSDAERFGDASWPRTGAISDAGTALVIFDRQRHANGRDAAFIRPQPEALPSIARWLHAQGVRQLLIVLPHNPASLPDALKAGLASLDEHAVSALGFDHVVFVRSAQAPADAPAAAWLQRLADGVLAQLRMMVPQTAQPVRVHKVAQFAVELAAQLPHSPPGTRVAPPELVWQAAQLADPQALVAAWLGGIELPHAEVKPARM
ncbi:hypothetical protein BH11PSE9_BH11PSE9_10100 [soil metagenome]